MARIPLGALTTLNLSTHLDPMFVELYAAAAGGFQSVSNFYVGAGTGNALLYVNGGSAAAQGGALVFQRAGSGSFTLGNAGSILGGVEAGDTMLYSTGAVNQRFYTNNVERMRVTSAGKVCVNSLAPLINGSRFNAACDAGELEVAACFKTSPTADPTIQTIDIWNATTTGNSSFALFLTEASPTARGSISFNRGGGLVAYNTTSDYRAKTVLGAVSDPGSAIDAMRPILGRMHGATIARPMFIAHELAEVAPYAVTGEKDAVDADKNPVFQQVSESSLVPLLVAELQDVRRRLAALESA